jgi:hypothetical protein
MHTVASLSSVNNVFLFALDPLHLRALPKKPQKFRDQISKPAEKDKSKQENGVNFFSAAVTLTQALILMQTTGS